MLSLGYRDRTSHIKGIFANGIVQEIRIYDIKHGKESSVHNIHIFLISCNKNPFCRCIRAPDWATYTRKFIDRHGQFFSCDGDSPAITFAFVFYYFAVCVVWLKTLNINNIDGDSSAFSRLTHRNNNNSSSGSNDALPLCIEANGRQTFVFFSASNGPKGTDTRTGARARAHSLCLCLYLRIPIICVVAGCGLLTKD